MSNDNETHTLNTGFAQMFETGTIMDVSSVEEAQIAEAAGAVAVMALDEVPSKLRARGGVARMSSLQLIKQIQDAVSIPVMAKCRIGHELEARVLQEIGVDFVDESEVLTPADRVHIDKTQFRVPFVCGAKTLGEALRRIQEGAAMIRSKGEAGTGDVSHAVRHLTQIRAEIAELQYKSLHALDNPDSSPHAHALSEFCHRERIYDQDLLVDVVSKGRLPVVLFAAGGVATPADAALLMERGADGVFVGSGVFESSQPPSTAAAMCRAVHCHEDPAAVAAACAAAGCRSSRRWPGA